MIVQTFIDRGLWSSARRITRFGVLAVATLASGLHGQDDGGGTQVQTELNNAAQAIQDDRPADALVALQSAETLERDNPWISFYRGVANLNLGDWYASLASFDRAQDLLAAYGNPEPELSRTITEYRAQARRQVFGITLQTGLIYDSNVTFFGSESTGFAISGQEDGKFGSALHVAYSPVATAEESFTIGARAVNTWLFSVTEFNDQDYGATFLYTRRFGERWEAALQYDYDILYFGNQPFSSNHVLSPSIRYDWDRRFGRFEPTATTLYYRIESRDYLFETEPQFDRDGFTNVVGMDQKFSLRPLETSDWTCELSAGYSFSSVATDGSEFDRYDHDFRLGASMPLKNVIWPDRRMTLDLSASWQIGDYRKPSLIDGNRDQRDDVIMSFDAVITQELVRSPETGDLDLHLIVGWSDAESNVVTSDRSHPFSYDKWVAGFQIAWSW